MAFSVTPATSDATARPAGVDVAVIDFITDPGACTVTRGVGENSHIITILKAMAAEINAAMKFNLATNSMYVALIEDI